MLGLVPVATGGRLLIFLLLNLVELATLLVYFGLFSTELWELILECRVIDHFLPVEVKLSGWFQGGANLRIFFKQVLDDLQMVQYFGASFVWR